MLLDCLLGSNCNQVTASDADGLIKDLSHDPGLVEGFLYPGMLTDFEGDQEQAQAETDMDLNKEDADTVKQTRQLEDNSELVLPVYVAKDAPIRTNEIPGGIVQPEGTGNQSGKVMNEVTLNVSAEAGLVTKDADLSELIPADNGSDHVNSMVEGKNTHYWELQQDKTNISLGISDSQEAEDCSLSGQGQRQMQIGQIPNERVIQTNNSPKMPSGNIPVVQMQDISGFENGINTIVKEGGSHPLDNAKNLGNIQIIGLMPNFVKKVDETSGLMPNFIRKEDETSKVSSDQPNEDISEIQSTIELSFDTKGQSSKQLTKEKVAIPVAFEKSAPDKGIGNQVNQGSIDRVIPEMKEELKPIQDNINRNGPWPSNHDLAQNANVKGMEASSSLTKDVPLTQLPAKLHEMVKGLLVQQHAGYTTLKMKLQPEHLGEVTVKLIWSKGELSAQFLTSSGLAKEALETTFPQLRELLAQQNIRLSEAAVFMGQQTNGQWDQNSFAERQRWQENGPKKVKGYQTEINLAEEQLPASGVISPNSGLNLVV